MRYFKTNTNREVAEQIPISLQENLTVSGVLVLFRLFSRARDSYSYQSRRISAWEESPFLQRRR